MSPHRRTRVEAKKPPPPQVRVHLHSRHRYNAAAKTAAGLDGWALWRMWMQARWSARRHL